jgi:hypothetical protein
LTSLLARFADGVAAGVLAAAEWLDGAAAGDEVAAAAGVDPPPGELTPAEHAASVNAAAQVAAAVTAVRWTSIIISSTGSRYRLPRI